MFKWSLFLFVQHGFTEDNLEELLFAVLQLLQEGEEPGTRYVQIIDQIFQEFLAEMKADASKVNTEVSWQDCTLGGVALTKCLLL